jgi:HEPN domain-containing protein
MAFHREQHIAYWVATAEADLRTAKDIALTGKHYHFVLFLCHLSIEKMLKAHVVKATDAVPPKTHDLTQLAEKANLSLTTEQARLLLEINTFNLSTRYPDTQLQLYKQATRTFAEPYIAETERMFQWLKTLL